MTYNIHRLTILLRRIEKGPSEPTDIPLFVHLTNALRTVASLTLYYIRGHAGFKGNKAADEAAGWEKHANHSYLPLSKTDVGRKITRGANEWRHNQLIALEKSGSETTMWYRRTTNFASTNPLLRRNLSGKQFRILRLIGQLRSGHCYLIDTWRARMGYYRTLAPEERGTHRREYCSFCNREPGTPEHFLCHCIRFREERRAISDKPIRNLYRLCNLNRVQPMRAQIQ